MDKNSFFIGNGLVTKNASLVNGRFVEIKGEKYYKIEGFNNMSPFFISIVSSSDHWMFISSNGALTAGRKNPDNALFPYYTDDKISDNVNITGNLSLFFIKKNNRTYFWEPFSINQQSIYTITRNLYKNVIGNKIIFEEFNHNLEIGYQYTWCNSEKFGIIKNSEIINKSKDVIHIEVLDGIQNILPYGITRVFQNMYSNLANAYKKNELIPDSKIGIYYLSSIPTDKAEPSEGLKSTMVWSTGLENCKVLLSSNQVEKYRKGEKIYQEEDVRASRGAYLLNSEFSLNSNDSKHWNLIADVNKDISDIKKVEKIIKRGENIEKVLIDDIYRGTENLIKITANADGIQITKNELVSMRHFSNVLFNVMRGGIFNENYSIYKPDFLSHLEKFNKEIFKKFSILFNNLNDKFQLNELIEIAEKSNNIDLLRICYEYLPLTFSRRHGDPSRPWNLFSIETKNSDGSKSLNYQGNWRDIFQNWEALSFSFPEFIESMICKFVNASTIDGYNPYRITNEGIDWEIIDPHDPWSNIGYWGDHQIIYLQKLVELSHQFHPGKLQEFLVKDMFVYSNVPYKLKTYDLLIKDPRNSIDFDEPLQSLINTRVEKIGADGKLYWTKNNQIYKVNLTEKLLISILAKLCNFLPEGGIWMNTQRPEWNDANNALVGNGLSMVTLYYLKRTITFWINIVDSSTIDKIKVSEEIIEFLWTIKNVFEKNSSLLNNTFTNFNKKEIIDNLGMAGNDYRNQVYSNGFSGNMKSIEKFQLIEFFELTLQYIDHSIRANKRNDGLYHAYNIMNFKNDHEVEIQHLYEMLEGQVAILGSGYLNSDETVEILDSLRKSKLYREDQNSYLLYPNRQLKKFMDKNSIPIELLKKSKLLLKLIKDNNTQIVNQDITGEVHFSGDFRNNNDVQKALRNLDAEKYAELEKKESQIISDIFEQVFDHRIFTGRSGTFYGYEGLGCIYWHMVSKLLLAVQENYFRAIDSEANPELIEKLKKYYYEIKDGIGVNKSPDQYGAFPTEPYSHTPGDGGVKQPGMTGQVKEDILSRFGELGICIKEGEVHFNHTLLNSSEFLKIEKEFTFYNIHNNKETIQLKEASLAYTFCQVPIVYQLSASNEILILYKNDKLEKVNGNKLNQQASANLFSRNGEIKRITVNINNLG